MLFVHAMLLPVRAVCKAMANRKYCPRTVVLSNPGGPQCPICVPTLLPVSGSLRGKGGTGTGSQVPLAVYASKLVMSSLDEPRCQHSPYLLSVTHPPWHCHCQELPHILYFPFFFKVTLSLKRKVLIFIQRKKTCFSTSSLSPFPKLAPCHFFKLHVHCS